MVQMSRTALQNSAKNMQTRYFFAFASALQEAQTFLSALKRFAAARHYEDIAHRGE